MHILLTDLLTCPRCGPEFGLILLGHAIEDRRVLDGELGCPNCRDRYPVRDGFGDLRAPPRSSLEPVGDGPEPGSEEATLQVAALLGVSEGPGHLVLAGPVARHARALSDALDDVEVVGVDPRLRAWPEEGGVSRVAASPGLPFYSGRIRGVALEGTSAADLLDEAVRIVGPRSRVAVLDAPAETRSRLEGHGLQTVMEDRGAVVAART